MSCRPAVTTFNGRGGTTVGTPAIDSNLERDVYVTFDAVGGNGINVRRAGAEQPARWIGGVGRDRRAAACLALARGSRHWRRERAVFLSTTLRGGRFVKRSIMIASLAALVVVAGALSLSGHASPGRRRHERAEPSVGKDGAGALGSTPRRWQRDQHTELPRQDRGGELLGFVVWPLSARGPESFDVRLAGTKSGRGPCRRGVR